MPQAGGGGREEAEVVPEAEAHKMQLADSWGGV